MLFGCGLLESRSGSFEIGGIGLGHLRPMTSSEMLAKAPAMFHLQGEHLASHAAQWCVRACVRRMHARAFLGMAWGNTGRDFLKKTRGVRSRVRVLLALADRLAPFDQTGCWGTCCC